MYSSLCSRFTRVVNKQCTTITSKINGTPKGIRLSEKLQHCVMKIERSNKFNLCYYMGK